MMRWIESMRSDICLDSKVRTDDNGMLGGMRCEERGIR
jgi:hypothetical protein